MKAAILVLTPQGLSTAHRVVENWHEQEPPEIWAPVKVLQHIVVDSEEAPVTPYSFEHLKEAIPGLWQRCSPLIFIMATGIVVRHIAPYLQGKERDPAVLVLDEKGEFVIPLLSGHLGGANVWANQLGDWLKAQPVITTATDIQGIVAPDQYARQFGWAVEPVAKLREVNSLLLRQGYLEVWSDCLPKDHPLRSDSHYHFLEDKAKTRAQIWITAKEFEGPEVLLLIPRLYSVGVGCRKGIASEHVRKAILDALQQLGLAKASLKGIYSIDLKAKEAGIVETAHSLGVPFTTFAAEQIQEINERADLLASDYVKEMIGVDGVCEAASLLGAKLGELVLPKQKYRGVTVAISKERSM